MLIRHNILFTLSISVVLLASLVSCEKATSPPAPQQIRGPLNVCPGDSLVTYSIDGSNTSDYLWTVPSDAIIRTGQGSAEITVNFGQTAGNICVRANSGTEISEPTCIFVDQGGVPNQWCRQRDFKGAPRSKAIAFAINGKGYFGTGLDENDQGLRDFWEFDPVANIWTRKSDYPGEGRGNAVAFVIGGKGYVGTGANSLSYFKDFWEYNPVSDEWRKIADFGGGLLSQAFSFTLTGKGYVGCGKSPTERKELWEYDPGLNVWTEREGLSTFKVSEAVAFSLGGKGYACTGFFTVGKGVRDEVWEFDPSDNSIAPGMGRWFQKKSFPGGPRVSAVSFLMGDKAYISCGSESSTGGYKKDLWEYDVANDEWIQKAGFEGNARSNACGFVIGKKAYLGSGLDEVGKRFSDFWVYGQ
jgi:N-acetylneuraminic acid mutarotase